MKNKLIYITTILLAIIGFSCEPEKVTEGISQITYFPEITVNGEVWNTVKVGETFTDPGAKAVEGETEITVKVVGAVDTSKPGVYTLRYDAVNADGFSSSEYRYVGVISPSVEGLDLTGAYKRTAGDMGISNVTKISDNLYYADNVGGVAVTDPSLGVYFYHYDAGKLGVPYQRTPGNAFEAIDATVDVGVSYSWVVINSGYGTALRTFIKQ